MLQPGIDVRYEGSQMFNIQATRADTSRNDKDIEIWSLTQCAGRYYGLSEGRGDLGASSGNGIGGVAEK